MYNLTLSDNNLISRHDMLDWTELRVVIICDLDFTIIYGMNVLSLNLTTNLVAVLVYMYTYDRGYLKSGDYVDLFSQGISHVFAIYHIVYCI